MRKLRAGLLVVLLVVLATAASADPAVYLTMSPNTLSGLTGQTLTFTGDLFNDTGSTVVFVGGTIALAGVNPSDYWFSFIDDMAIGEVRNGADILQVYVAPYLATGSYTGTVYLDYEYGGSGGTTSDSFVLDVTHPVPEPAFVQLPALLGLGALAWWRRRRAR